MIRYLFNFYYHITTFFWCTISGLKYNSTWIIDGKIHIQRNRLLNFYKRRPCGKLIIGNRFECHNTFDSNAIGLIQPTLFNISYPNSRIVIGNNVGISGCTLNAMKEISIGDNTMIGSGCLIMDNDSHVLNFDNRQTDNRAIKHAPVHIGSKVFIGARCIITKGVTIGDNVVIGAGSVVTKNIPANSIAAGNPAIVLKKI